jgi:hypothetical protein
MDRYTSNTSIHTALGATSLNDETIKEHLQSLYQLIRRHDNLIIAALGNDDIRMHFSYTRPKQILH